MNSVAPGFIRTDLYKQRWSTPEAGATRAALSGFGRTERPGDIADVVAFLASDDSRWVTGQCIDASGGTEP